MFLLRKPADSLTPQIKTKAQIICIVVGGMLLTIWTRGITLTYHMSMHPDEAVFTTNTYNLLYALLKPGTPYVEVKEYPEGAYFFQLPFTALGVLLSKAFGLTYNARIWGRIASVFYFTLCLPLGVYLLTKYMKGSASTAIVYILTMCFSVFFIEQSRYGTGDMISLFLLLLILALTAKTLSSGNSPYLIAAFAGCGALGAVKWPLIFWTLIPLGVLLFTSLGKNTMKKLKLLCIGGVVTIAVFLLFSPNVARDLGYFSRAAKRELEAYVTAGTSYEHGGFLNHIAEVLIFSLLYSDFPCSILFASAAIKDKAELVLDCDGSADYHEHDLRLLFYRIIPVATLLFLVYNLLVSLLVFRTLTPFWGVVILYSSPKISLIFSGGGYKKTVVVMLSMLMVLRGSLLIYVLSDEEKVNEHMMQTIETAVDENWENTYCIDPYVMPLSGETLHTQVRVRIDSEEDFYERGVRLSQGDLVVTGAYQFGLGYKYIFPTQSERNTAWELFKSVNHTYFKGQSYPDSMYFLFGGWIRGGTLSTFTMPCNQIYYRGAED